MVDHTSEKLKHVAFSVIIAVAVLTILGSVILGSISTEGFEISEATLKKGTTTDAILLVSVKSLGNSPISDIKVTIDGLSLTGTVPSKVVGTESNKAGAIIGYTSVTPATTPATVTDIQYRVQTKELAVGGIASIAVKIPNSASLQTGSSYTITVEATSGGETTLATGSGGIAETTGGTKIFETGVVYITRI